MPKVTEEHLSARRQQIMDAAVECFSREGFHRTTMQNIITETGMSAGSIYRYFASKEDIVAAIANDHHAPEASVLERIEEFEDPREALIQLARASLGRLNDPAERRWRRVTVQLWAEALRNPRIMEVVRSGLDAPIDQLTSLFEKAQQAGYLAAPIDPGGAARVCASLFQGLVVQQTWDPLLDVEPYMGAVSTLIEQLMPARR
ncbi:MAG: TetR/AcrR family transcriptional regulator [Acidimicrobiales bacterium]|jgi:AcrR family transcriptional regulator